VVTSDGQEVQRVACRLGIVNLSRRVCYNHELDTHVMPGNGVLPPHAGMIVTRNLQEWVCLLPLDLPFETVERLLRWQTQCDEMICATEVRSLVRTHGQVIRQAEAAEVAELLHREDLGNLKANLVPAQVARHPAAWPEELTAAVEQALERGDPQPPEGVRACDWERVLAARREEHVQYTLADLRHLGPEVQPGQIVAATDDVEVRRPEDKRKLSLRTARIATPEGFRYLSGCGQTVLDQLYLLLLLCGGPQKWVSLLGDGARWIRDFFTQRLATFAHAELILDWYHLLKKCYDLTSMICRGRAAKAVVMGRLITCLWRGQVHEAVAHLEAHRSECRNAEKLDDLINYLTARAPYIVNYKERRAKRIYIGSAHAEKANDLIVARRQKHQGMHWSEATADGLAALKTLILNGGWDLYWQRRKVLPLAVPT
jgi:hypothetical protein